MTDNIPVVFIKIFDEICTPEQKGDWIDLKARRDYTYEAGSEVNVELGVAMKVPIGYECHVLPRSSTFSSTGLLMRNSMGIIDNAYCGDNDQWIFPGVALKPGSIKAGQRICQFRLVPRQIKPQLIQCAQLQDKDRGGLGSTGTGV